MSKINHKQYYINSMAKLIQNIANEIQKLNDMPDDVFESKRYEREMMEYQYIDKLRKQGIDIFPEQSQIKNKGGNYENLKLKK